MNRHNFVHSALFFLGANGLVEDAILVAFYGALEGAIRALQRRLMKTYIMGKHK